MNADVGASVRVCHLPNASQAPPEATGCAEHAPEMQLVPVTQYGPASQASFVRHRQFTSHSASNIAVTGAQCLDLHTVWLQ